MYIVIELFGGVEYASICTNEDGKNIVFESKEEAEKFAKKECQDGIVVEVMR
jgi:hypothetical protein